MNSVKHIRNELGTKYKNNEFVIDKSGVKMVELIGANFIADEDHIFGTPNKDYIKRELEWYNSQSLKVSDIPGDTPKIWNDISSTKGEINSNYGYLIFSKENGNQYKNVYEKLLTSPLTRQASMIYTRPTIHADAHRDEMSDFICTHAVNYFTRNRELSCVVQMRSNDAWAGYRNDYAWQKYVLELLARDLNINVGKIYWNAASLHVYERNFNLIERYLDNG